MAEHKRHMDVPQERFSESPTQPDAGDLPDELDHARQAIRQKQTFRDTL
ncbi:hypothetical protein BY454_104100 [Marinobacter persicus]|jgi:hypothetical protein|uniref:Uncharacterized protein n=1 Tax=Marinobacter persicus TaxID=930118 RepID=A0A2S6G8W6_9GAMM|nr:hypothetical protein BY455_104100 [Marinobacter persicus]PPK55674.1 hypothetical protein B0H24_100476 [Marinobacter persicus]PPK59291.1 hypothetical protein BY454_104100 [Marinobacter persicus]